MLRLYRYVMHLELRQLFYNSCKTLFYKNTDPYYERKLDEMARLLADLVGYKVRVLFIYGKYLLISI